jgi:hypothetical protein
MAGAIHNFLLRYRGRTRLIQRDRTVRAGVSERSVHDWEPVPRKSVPAGWQSYTHPGKLFDIVMLLIGGRERTEPEWRRVFELAGLRLTGITPIPTRTGAGVIEACQQATC